MKKFILAAILGVMGVGFNASLASASDPHCQYKKVITYETVTVYVTKQVPYTTTVTKYDYYGRAYTETVTVYKEVRVPVQKTVEVVKWVPVYN